ncbi:MAG: branched-chain amino acid ABC transporter permease [Deltaproteobacteria bacterium HGW-Deltaproteobacteria-15]|nr:MAG: branched-chain amino acid ABC transporter permease [Deltaproteobacteria bacterium HGW-Deltaproteobacteria-15]
MKPGEFLKKPLLLILLLAFTGILFLPFILSSYYAGLVIQIFVMAIFAASLDILVGHTGLPSMGHASYFGVAGYATAFLVLSGVKNAWLVMGFAVAMGGLTAALFGLLAIRAQGPYFMLITVALSQVLWGIAFKWRSITMGDDGLPGIRRPEIGMGLDLASDVHFYYFSFGLFLLVLLALYILVNSPFGHSLRGIRESESRMKALGYNVWLYKYLSFVFAGAFAGISGSLWVFYSGFVNPSSLGIDMSVKALLMLILGGSGSLFGPAIGAGIIVLLENIVSGLTERWSLILGMVYVVVIMLFSEGITSILKRGRSA